MVGRSIGWCATGARLAAVGVNDPHVHLWDTETDVHAELRGHSGDILQLAWDWRSPDILATGARDKTTRFWDVRAPGSHATVVTPGEVHSLAWSPDCQQLAVCGKGDAVSIIDVRKNRIVLTHPCAESVCDVAWDRTGALLFTAYQSGIVQIYEYPSMKAALSLQGHTSTVYCIEMRPDGQYFATGSADSTTCLWSKEDLACVRTFTDTSVAIRDLSLSLGGEYIAVASEDSAIVYSTETGLLCSSLWNRGPANAVAWHPSRPLLAFCAEDPSRRDPVPVMVAHPSTS
eukprot:c615_g1_i1.p1 GENE.c615_g1_i1~~c615_g1_i1.p1  ORF type:complete len:319 (-),score=21.13 c615_g1_i1:618-1481(-)